ncbi:hypothetical protein [Chitinilyticum piscinae]|uniref:Uncharacterized protein n=1 Tax=Chitinilyticum piscinae TaxID=2866724 RepID=A0A8J7K8Z3_9NEIS|nr:hypothetical protein [Chitinilyticum piscinae]MBE9610423.1 hypothetical protein [Chitinilyticum piscinae]
MWEQGQISRQCLFWMSERDIVQFSTALQQLDLPWSASLLSPHHLNSSRNFPSLIEALDYGTGSAYCHLALGSVSFHDPERHIAGNRQSTANHKDNYSPDFVYPPDGVLVGYGDMAVRWNKQDGDEQQQAIMAAQVKSMFSLLTKCTLPAKLQTTGGRPVNGYRIGPDMQVQARTHQWFLKSNGPTLRLI